MFVNSKVTLPVSAIRKSKILLLSLIVRNMSVSRPKVGLAVFITSDKYQGKVILGKRKNSIGAGTYAPPGGHIEYGESFEECARRETLEETGLKLKNFHCDTVVNVFWPEKNYHYIDVLTRAEIDEEYKCEPENMEPHKCEGWSWWSWEELPAHEELFRPLQAIVESGYTPFPKS